MSEEKKQSDYQQGLKNRVADEVTTLLEYHGIKEVDESAIRGVYEFIRGECLQSFKTGKRAGLASKPAKPK